MKVAVIGAGATGTASARFLAKAGHDVTLFEQFEQGHGRGSSHGTSRIIRRTYPDPYYTRLIGEVYELWAGLEFEAVEKLYEETGLLTFGVENSEWLRDCRHSLRDSNLQYDELGPVDVARRFGGFHLDPGEVAIYEYGAGFLKADRVLQANIRIAEAHGAKIVFNRRAKPRPDGTVAGEKFDAIALCAGAWITQFVEEPLVPRRQQFAYFAAPMLPIPVWVDSCEAHCYGFPDYGRGFKVGRHLYGPPIDPSETPPEPDPEVLKDLAEQARRRLGADGSPLEAFNCLYTVAPNEDFRVGRLPWEVPAFYISGCSGHGFKFTVWFGKLMLELIEGSKTAEDFPRFCSPR